MRIAAIDIGTNSLHMIVCRIRPDLSFEVIDREKDMVRLGTGGLDGRGLAPANATAAIQTLSKFMRIAASHGVDEIVAAATSAVREADNGADWVAAVKRELGLHVRVISGTEEARLIHLAAGYAADVGKNTAVVIDIGGGSTEITAGTSERMQTGRSFKLGVIRLTERFVKTDPLSHHDRRRLVRYVKKETGSYLRQLSRRRIDRVIGTSGTILSLGALAADRREAEDIRNLRVSAKALARMTKHLTEITLEDRLRLPNLDPRRADLAPAGALLLDTLLEGLDAEEITLCDFALREGLVLDYVQRNAQHIRTVDRYPDARRRSVIELGERYSYFPVHAQYVSKLALQLFDATRPWHEFGQREREWLEYGALLHDIGTHISYERHHKHSYYLIRNGGLRGFEPEEVEMIGLIARYHRQATPKATHEGYADLTKDRRRAVRLLSAMVRLAEGLDRSHAQVISKLTIKLSKTAIDIRMKADGDAELELWAAGRHAAALAEAFDVAIRFDLAGRQPRTGKAASRSPKRRAAASARRVRRRPARA